MAYIYKLPSKIEFSLKYADDTENIAVSHSADGTDVSIKKGREIWIDCEDLDWLIAVLKDIKDYLSVLPDIPNPMKRGVSSN